MDMIKEPKNEDTSMYLLVRHSERVDQVSSKSDKIELKNIEDPEITTNGKKMAHITGISIANIVKNLKEKSCINKNAIPCIISSPYIRCLQTSVYIGKLN